MPSHQDLLQAHRLMTQRSALALISGEPDTPDQPLRRLNVGTVSGLLAAAITAAVFAVLGLAAPGHGTSAATGLTRAGTLVVDSASATAYVPCGGGRLCPALNYPSALLALDTTSVRRVTAGPAALTHYSLGPTIGVAGLPQDLPAGLVTGPWAVCAARSVTTLVGGRPVGGTVLGAGSAALASTGQSDIWVLWNGRRLAIEPAVAQTLFPAMQLLTVPAAWLNTLPEGPPFAAPQIAGQGTEVTGPEGAALAGQVFEQAGAGGAVSQYYVLLADGKLAQVTATQAQLLAREPGAPAARPITPSLATANVSGTTIPRGSLPATIPAVAPVGSALCVTYGPDLVHHLVTGAAVPSGAVAAASGAALTRVWLPPAHGALIAAAPGTTAPGTTVAGTTAAGATVAGVTGYFLLTGATRYALPSPSIAAVLGYTLKSQSAVLPAAVLGLLPAGPPLSPAAATKPAAG